MKLESVKTMKPVAQANSPEKATPEVARNPSEDDVLAEQITEKITEWRTESKEQCDELKQQIASVSVRVSQIEEVVNVQAPQHALSQYSVSSPAFSVETPQTQRSVTFQTIEESSWPLTEESFRLPGIGTPQRKALKQSNYGSTLTVTETEAENGAPPTRGPSLLERRPKAMSTTCTIWAQQKIASEIPIPFRILGTCLGFITVVLIWEFTDGVMKKFFPVQEVRLISYLGLSVSAAVLLALSHQWMRIAEADSNTGTLMPSFAYSLSTLFTAIGFWGTLVMAVRILLPSHMELFVYGAGGSIALFLTIGYAIQTKHNVLLDIASCATTLGLHKDELDDGDVFSSGDLIMPSANVSSNALC